MSGIYRSRKETHGARKKKRKSSIALIGVAIGLAAAIIFVVGLNRDDLRQLAGDTAIQEGEKPYEQKNEQIDKPLDLTNSPNPVLQPAQETEASQDQDVKVSLAFVGDVLLGSSVETYYLSKQGYDYPYTYVKEQLTKSDVTVANLETPITLRGDAEDKTYAYRSHPDALPAFVEAGFDVVNLANNHILDYGLDGLNDSLKHLDDANVLRVGAGLNEEEAYRPSFVEKNGIKIAFLGFSRVVPNVSWKAGKDNPGVAETYDYTRPVAAIEQANEKADLVIVLAHWGDERETEPNKHQIEMAHRYIDAGADLVVGSHPHVLQGFEQYKGKWIAYSLGNFIFTTNENQDTWKSAILTAECTQKASCELTLDPVWNQAAQPKPMDEQDAQALYGHLSIISKNAVIRENGEVREIH